MSILVAAKHMESPFTGKRVLKGQAIVLPPAKKDETPAQIAAREKETDRIVKRLIEGGLAEMADTAIGPYNPVERDHGGTSGIHFDIPERIEHDGTPESAERIKQLRLAAAERKKVADRKKAEAEKNTGQEADDGKGAEDAGTGEGAGIAKDSPSADAPTADDKSSKKGKGK